MAIVYLQWTFISSQFGKLEVWVHGVSIVCSWWGFCSWLVGGHHLSVCSCDPWASDGDERERERETEGGRNEREGEKERERESSLVCLLRKTQILLDEGLIFVTFDLYYCLIVLIFKYNHIGGQGLQHMNFGGHISIHSNTFLWVNACLCLPYFYIPYACYGPHNKTQ